MLRSHRFLEQKKNNIKSQIVMTRSKIEGVGGGDKHAPAPGNVLFQEARYCGLTGHGIMKEKAKTTVRQRNKERKKTAVRQWVSLESPSTSLQPLFNSVAGGSTPSSPLFRGSPSVGQSVVSMVLFSASLCANLLDTGTIQ